MTVSIVQTLLERAIVIPSSAGLFSEQTGDIALMEQMNIYRNVIEGSQPGKPMDCIQLYKTYLFSSITPLMKVCSSEHRTKCNNKVGMDDLEVFEHGF